MLAFIFNCNHDVIVAAVYFIANYVRAVVAVKRLAPYSCACPTRLVVGDGEWFLTDGICKTNQNRTHFYFGPWFCGLFH